MHDEGKVNGHIEFTHVYLKLVCPKIVNKTTYIVNLLFDERLGIIVGSLASGLVGYFVLNRCLPKKA